MTEKNVAVVILYKYTANKWWACGVLIKIIKLLRYGTALLKMNF